MNISVSAAKSECSSSVGTTTRLSWRFIARSVRVMCELSFARSERTVNLFTFRSGLRALHYSRDVGFIERGERVL